MQNDVELRLNEIQELDVDVGVACKLWQNIVQNDVVAELGKISLQLREKKNCEIPPDNSEIWFDLEHQVVIGAIWNVSKNNQKLSSFSLVRNRFCVGDISYKRFVLARCLGGCQFIEAGWNTT